MNSPATDGPAGHEDSTTLDRLLAGRLLLRQPARGHRAGTDAVLLAGFAEPPAGGTVIDLGAGVGTVGLILALREPRLTVVLVESDPFAAALARDNVAMNGMADRVAVEERDAFTPDPVPRANLVVCNPPFYTQAEARPSPEPRRAGAHHLGARGHAAWLAAALRHVRARGHVAMINRPEALPALLGEGARGAGGFVVRPVHPRAGAAATRLLLRSTAGGRAPLRILAPLILHGPDGGFTAEAAALHQGCWAPETHESRP